MATGALSLLQLCLRRTSTAKRATARHTQDEEYGDRICQLFDADKNEEIGFREFVYGLSKFRKFERAPTHSRRLSSTSRATLCLVCQNIYQLLRARIFELPSA